MYPLIPVRACVFVVRLHAGDKRGWGPTPAPVSRAARLLIAQSLRTTVIHSVHDARNWEARACRRRRCRGRPHISSAGTRARECIYMGGGSHGGCIVRGTSRSLPDDACTVGGRHCVHTHSSEGGSARRVCPDRGVSARRGRDFIQPQIKGTLPRVG